MKLQILVDMLALNKYGQRPFDDDGVVELFAFLLDKVAIHLRQHLRRVEHIVAQGVDERENEGGFRGLLGVKI